jgi:hypothetical protein
MTENAAPTGHHSASPFTALKGHLGPVPIWVIAVGGVALAVYFLNQQATSPKAEADASAPADEVGFGNQPFSANPGGGNTGTPAPTVNGQVPTNDTWLRAAVDWLRGQGVDVGLAQSAIAKYLSGTALNKDEKRIRDMVIAQFGLPPNLPDAVTTTPEPVPALPGESPTAPAPGAPAAPKPAVQPEGVRTDSTLNGVVNYGWMINTATDYTLDSVARRYGLTTAQLRTLNPTLASARDDSVIMRGADIKVRTNAIIRPVIQGTSPTLAASGKAKPDPYSAPKAIPNLQYKSQPKPKSYGASSGSVNAPLPAKDLNAPVAPAQAPNKPA